MIASIYKVTNKNDGKIYIGFTTKSLEKRKSQHLRPRKHVSLLHLAIKKHGEVNFEWEIIYQSKDVKHTLEVMEQHFIDKYNSIENGYNICRGGSGPVGRPSKYKGIPSGIEPWNKGKECPEIAERMTGKNNHQFGRKKKGSEQEKKRIQTLCKKVWEFVSPTGEVHRFKNLGDFCRSNSLRPDAMNRVHSGKYLSHRGWTRFISDNELPQPSDSPKV